MRRPPVPGEVFVIDGETERHPYFGKQLVAHSAKCERPQGIEICALLSRHPIFKLSKRNVEKLWKTLSHTLYQFLEREDIVSLNRSGVSASTSLELVRAWSRYIAEIETAEHIMRWALPSPADVDLFKNVQLFSGLSISNPYLYIPELSWSDVEPRASKAFPQTNRERLVAACLSVFCRRREVSLTPIPEEEYLRRLTSRLGRRRIALDALKKAIEDGHVEKFSYASNSHIVLSSHRLICQQLSSRLFYDSSDSPQLPSLLRKLKHSSARPFSLCSLIICDGMNSHESTINLYKRLPNAVHVIPFFDTDDDGTASEKIRKITTGKLLLEKLDDLPELVVIHTANGYDLLGLNKILHCLPKNAQVILSGHTYSSGRNARPAPFLTLVRTNSVPSAYLTSVGFRDSSPLRKNSPSRVFSEVSTSEHEVVSNLEVTCRLCSAYRSARSAGTVVILCNDSLLRRRINDELQAELSQETVQGGANQPRIRISGGGEASAGAPMTWSSFDWARVRLPGEQLTLLQAHEHAYLRVDGAIPEMVKGNVERNNGVIEDVTLSDARRLVLAYALAPSQCGLGTWDTVIVYYRGAQTSLPHWASIASTRARKSVVVVRSVGQSQIETSEWNGTDPVLASYFPESTSS